MDQARPAPRFRLSLARTMLIILLVGLAIGSLRSPSPLLASAVWTVTAALLCWATVGPFIFRDHRRAFWAGFAVFGWVHLILIFRLYRLDIPAGAFLPLPPLLYDPVLERLRDWLVPPQARFATFSLSVTSSGSSYLIGFDQIASLLAVLTIALIGGGMASMVSLRASRRGDNERH